MSGKEKTSERLSAYMDGELSPAQSRRIAGMIREDPDLAAELEALRTVRRLLRGLPVEPAPAGLVEYVLDRSRTTGAPAGAGRSAGWWVSRLARAAVVLLAVGIGVTMVALFHPERVGPPPHRTESTDYETLARDAGPTGKPGAGRAGKVLAGEGTGEGFKSGRNLYVRRGLVTKLSINTDNLARTQGEVEGVFDRNSIAPVVRAAVRRGGGGRMRGRGNFYWQGRTTPKQVRIEVVADEKQMRRIVAELSAIRAGQKVAQAPVGEDDSVTGSVALDLTKADGYGVGAGSRRKFKELKYKNGLEAERQTAKSEATSARRAREPDHGQLERLAEAARERESADRTTEQARVTKDEMDKMSQEKRLTGATSRPAPKPSARAPKPALAAAPPTAAPGTLKAAARTAPAGPATRPADVDTPRKEKGADLKDSLAVAKKQAATTTTAAADVRRLVIILNAVAGE